MLVPPACAKLAHEPDGGRAGRMVVTSLRIAAMLAMLLASVSSSQAALQGRDLDVSQPGFEAYYDPAQNLTWLADADYARTTGRSVDGTMTFAEALSWSATVEISGVKGWRPPRLRPVGVSGCTPLSVLVSDCGSPPPERSELPHLLIRALGVVSKFKDASGAVDRDATVDSPLSGYTVHGEDPRVAFEHVRDTYLLAAVYRQVIPCPDGAECRDPLDTSYDASSVGGYWSPDGSNYFRCLIAAQCGTAGDAGASGAAAGAAALPGTVSGSNEFYWQWRLDTLRIEQQPVADPTVKAAVWLVHDGDVSPVPEPPTWSSMLAALLLLGFLKDRRSGDAPLFSAIGLRRRFSG